MRDLTEILAGAFDRRYKVHHGFTEEAAHECADGGVRKHLEMLMRWRDDQKPMAVATLAYDQKILTYIANANR